MRYVLAVLCPPLAVLLCQGLFAATVNAVLSLCFWVPGVIHALCVVRQYRLGRRENRFLDKMQHRWLSLSVRKM